MFLSRSKVERSSPIQIWDGQHRTLGAYVAVDRKNAQLADLLHLATRARAEGNDDKLSSFILGVIKSDAFQMKKAEPVVTDAASRN